MFILQILSVEEETCVASKLDDIAKSWSLSDISSTDEQEVGKG